MTEHTPDADNVAIQLPDENEEFQVQGFVEAYERFLDKNPSLRAVSKWPELLLALVGGVIATMGILTLIFLPGSVMVDRISELNFSQSILLYPGYVFSLVALLFSVGMSLFAKAEGITPELFLVKKYTLIGSCVDLSDGSYFLEYLGESRFVLKRKTNADGDNGA